MGVNDFLKCERGRSLQSIDPKLDAKASHLLSHFFQAIENENAATALKRRTRDDLDLLTSHRGSARDESGPITAGSTPGDEV